MDYLGSLPNIINKIPGQSELSDDVLSVGSLSSDEETFEVEEEQLVEWLKEGGVTPVKEEAARRIRESFSGRDALDLDDLDLDTVPLFLSRPASNNLPTGGVTILTYKGLLAMLGGERA